MAGLQSFNKFRHLDLIVSLSSRLFDPLIEVSLLLEPTRSLSLSLLF